MQATATRRNTRLTTFVGFIVMVLIWGSFPVATKIGIQHAPPLLLSSTRFTLAFVVLAVIIRLQRKRLWISAKQHWHIFVVSLFMVSIPSSIFFASTPYAPVSVLTLLWAPTPIFTVLFNIRGSGEAHGWRLFASLCVGAIGVLIVLVGHIPFWPGTTEHGLALASRGPTMIAELAVLSSSAIYGLGMRLAKQENNDIPVTVFTTWQSFYTAAFVALMSLIFERGYVFHPTLATFGVLLYLVIFCSCISFFLVFWLIRRIGAIRTAYSDFIIPGVTLILSYFLLGESLTLAKLGGFVLVMLGCVLVETS